jgi:hypothetical protein
MAQMLTEKSVSFRAHLPAYPVRKGIPEKAQRAFSGTAKKTKRFSG